MKEGEFIKVIKKEEIEERGGVLIEKDKCTFDFQDRPSFSGDKEKSFYIAMSNADGVVGGITLEELNNKELGKDYIQLRVVHIKEKYRGGNASIILYEKAIEYAESIGKKLLFDSSLNNGAYNSFKKLENYGYDVIENPEAKYDGQYHTAYGSWVLRAERKDKGDEINNKK